jgi:predicted RNA polymerase sigma factor
VRAKRTIAEQKLAFELPETAALGARLRSVLDVLYLVFNEGYAATAGDDLVRADLVSEALRLGRLLAELAPAEPEVHGLVALMELQASRLPTRTDASGEPVLLADQDRSRWDALAIRRGLAALASAGDGSFALQAEIAACHARARTFDETDWKRIATLYEALAEIAPSPVIALNHAVAVSRAEGPAAGLALLDALASEPALAHYHLLPSARADLLEKLGRHDEARTEFERAASMTENAKQRQRLLTRAKAHD